MSEKLNIRQKLSALQQRVSIPKNRLNKFGGYKYWNCSDILNGVKKETEDLDGSILLNDEVQVIGDRFYIKATASLVDNDTDEVISVSAYAREPSQVKGQAEAQISGSSSSYARKYCLSGLLALDDEQDADATNTHGKEVPKGTTVVTSDEDIF